MALLEVRTEWAVYKDCFLQVARYQADNSRAIEIWNNEEGLLFGKLDDAFNFTLNEAVST